MGCLVKNLLNLLPKLIFIHEIHILQAWLGNLDCMCKSFFARDGMRPAHPRIIIENNSDVEELET